MSSSPIPEIAAEILRIVVGFSALANFGTQENNKVRSQNFKHRNQIANCKFSIQRLPTIGFPQILDSCRAIGRTQKIIEKCHLMPAITITR